MLEEKVPIKGRVLVRLMKATDINVNPGSSLYGSMKFTFENNPVCTAVTTSGRVNECIWSNSDDANESYDLVQEFSYTFTSTKPDDWKRSLILELELYNSFMGFFDSVAAKTKINLFPLLCYPKVPLEKWFSINNVNNTVTDNEIINSKVLLKMMFIPDKLPQQQQQQTTNNNNSGNNNNDSDIVNSDTIAATHTVDLSDFNDKMMKVSASLKTTDGSSNNNVVDGIVNEYAINMSSASIENIYNNNNNSSNNNDNKTVYKTKSFIETATKVPLEIVNNLIIEPSKQASSLISETLNPEDLLPLDKIDDTIEDLIENTTQTLQTINNNVSQNMNATNDMIKNIFVAPLSVSKDINDNNNNISNSGSNKNNSNNSIKLSKESSEKSAGQLQRKPSDRKNEVSAPSGQSNNQVMATTDNINSSNNNSNNNNASIVQSFMDFSEKTSNAIGNFFYDIETISHSRKSLDSLLIPTAESIANMQALQEHIQHKSDKIKKITNVNAHNNNNNKDNNVTGSGSKKKKQKPHDIVDYDNNDNDDIASTVSYKGVGTMYLNIKSAEKYGVTDASEGDYYILLTLEDLNSNSNIQNNIIEYKSNVVYHSATPQYNISWTLLMPYYRSYVKIHLVEAHSHRKIGCTKISVYDVMQRDSDLNIYDWRKLTPEPLKIRDIQDKEDIGHYIIQYGFEEDKTKSLLATNIVTLVCDNPQEEVSVERLAIHIARFTALMQLFSEIYEEYLHIMDWSDPYFTLLLLTIFLYCTIKISAEYAFSCVLFMCILLMTRTLYRRKTGLYKKYYLEKGTKSKVQEEYRPIAKIKMSILGYRNLKKTTNTNSALSFLNKTTVTSSIDPLDPTHTHTSLNAAVIKPEIRVSYYPMVEADADSTNSNNSTHNKNSNTNNITRNRSNSRGNTINALYNDYFGESIDANDADNNSNNIENNSNNDNDEDITSHTKEYIIGSFQGLQFTIPDKPLGVSQLMSNIVGITELPEYDSIICNNHHPWPADFDTISSFTKEFNSSNSSNSNNSNSSNTNTTTSNVANNDMVAHEFIKNDTADISLVYPILQPITTKVKLPNNDIQKRLFDENDNNNSNDNDKSKEKLLDSTTSTSLPYYLPWDKNLGIIKFTLIYHSGNSFLDADQEYIAISLKDLLLSATNDNSSNNNSNNGKVSGQQPEICRWFAASSSLHTFAKKQETNALTDLDNFVYAALNTDTTPQHNNNNRSNRNKSSPDHVFNMANNINNSDNINNTQVLIRIQLELPESQSVQAPTAQEKESSIILQKILSGKLNREEESSSDTISVIWNMREYIKYIQNLMNWLLDITESFKNIWNWTHPMKTFPIYMCIILLWVVTILIPGRLIILIIGLYEFFYIILPIPNNDDIVIRLQNLLTSIPNDDDIRQIYHRERTEFIQNKRKETKEMIKKTKLNLTLPTIWRGKVKIKANNNTIKANINQILLHSSHISGGSTNNNNFDWVDVYLILQGLRIVWWLNEDDMMIGKEAIGQILLCGHAGVSEASPIDIKACGDNSRLLAVFGKDTLGMQQKLSILCESSSDKQTLFSSIEGVVK